MRNVYFIYATIPEKIYNIRIKYLLSECSNNFRFQKNIMYGLYAWTDDKELLNEFKKGRDNKIYTIIKKKLDSEEFRDLKHYYKSLRLGMHKYKVSDSNTIKVVSTKFEHDKCTDEDGESYFYDFAPEIDFDLPISLFNKDIQQALDLLMYNEMYDRMYGDGDAISNNDYSKSYGLTPCGQKFVLNEFNELSLLLYLFKPLFVGFERND